MNGQPEPFFAYITDRADPTLLDIERRLGIKKFNRTMRRGELKDGTPFRIVTTPNELRGHRLIAYAVILHELDPTPRCLRTIEEMKHIANSRLVQSGVDR
jgi:hypothetical protein